ncbi:uncharacterized protein LOC114967797 [Acropora millepora]|uniref:uncharacterized protein LOC114967797 n=1 Tax=Acropora millepora TaxID=45264 RepID=UPI001CF2DF11|nr:uncharacterized protein LOC114967797 [Acropora millepora]
MQNLSGTMQHPSISESTDANLMARFVPIAPRAEGRALFPPGKKYDTPDFVSTVISMRQKLYELQGDSLSEEPTEEKDILKRWKASNSIIHGNVNDLRKYEHIATLSNRNFSKFMEISANADRCTRSGSVTQYTFKSIQKRMSEDEVHDKLCQILNGDATTVARLNKASATLRPAAGVDNETKSPSRSEINNNWREQYERERRKNEDYTRQIEKLQISLENCNREKIKAQRERDTFKGKTQELQRKVRELEFVIDDMQSRESKRLSKKSKIISSLQD